MFLLLGALCKFGPTPPWAKAGTFSASARHSRRVRRSPALLGPGRTAEQTLWPATARLCPAQDVKSKVKFADARDPRKGAFAPPLPGRLLPQSDWTEVAGLEQAKPQP